MRVAQGREAYPAVMTTMISAPLFNRNPTEEVRACRAGETETTF